MAVFTQMKLQLLLEKFSEKSKMNKRMKSLATAHFHIGWETIQDMLSD